MGRAPAAACAAVLLVLGCVHAATATDGAQGARYTRDLGRVMEGPLEEAREKVWSRHRYPLFRRRESSDALYWESEWVPRPLGPEEVGAGVTAGRVRLVLSGRRVGQNLDGTGIYSVSLVAENQERTEAAPEWRPAPMSAAVLETVRRVAADLELEVRAGIRR